MGRLLVREGVPLQAVIARQPQAAWRAVRFIGAGKGETFESLSLADASVFLVSVSDGATPGVAERLARLRDNWRGTVVLHTCGSLPASVLEPLRKRGAAVGSLHPFQTVPTRGAGVRNLLGCFWGIEGDAAALRVTRRWVRLLKGRAFPVRASRKTLYHASAVLSCGGLVALVEQCAQLLRSAGVPEKIARPMLAGFVAETVRNFGALGARRALTGPAVRSDWETIERHRRALRRFAPRALPIYDALTREMIRLAGKKAARAFRKAK
jgi:predicted short-subunit dehydrogenase-like oxidoreductase (DUF2520 family)